MGMPANKLGEKFTRVTEFSSNSGFCNREEVEQSRRPNVYSNKKIHTHTHIYIYIYSKIRSVIDMSMGINGWVDEMNIH